MLKNQQFKTQTKITIYTDGSCLGNPGKGGWAAIFQFLSQGKIKAEKRISGCKKETTNNQMELTAVIEALKALKSNANKYPIEIYTDSQYVQNGLTQWRDSWEYRNFRGVKNGDLWKELYNLTDKYKDISVIYVKAHTSNKNNSFNEKLNNEVDKLARDKAKNC